MFVDTPGFQTQHTNALNRAMNRGVTQALNDVDVVVFVIEAVADARTRAVLKLLPTDRPVILVVNKTDKLADRTSCATSLAQVSAARQTVDGNDGAEFAAVVPVSAAKGRQLDPNWWPRSPACCPQQGPALRRG